MAQPVPLRIDNDGTFAFSSAAFVQPAGWPGVLGAQRAHEHLGPGVEFERWHIATATGPLTLSLTRIDLHNPYVTLAVATRFDQIIGPGEVLSTMADRRAAEVGINADYFDIAGTGMPTNLVLAGGVVQHAPNGRATLLVGAANRITLGPIDWHAQIATAQGASISIDTVNDWSPDTQLMLFTQRFGLAGAANADAEVVLAPSGAGGYRVTKVGGSQPTFLPLSPEELGIAARGVQAATLLQTFHEGDAVTIHEAWDPPLPDLREGVGGGPIVLRGGMPFEDPNAPSPEERDVRYPVTGAGISADGATLLLVTVDGRAPSRSVGITRPMLGTLFAALGASDAMAFDSGGSTEMVIRRPGDREVSVANMPSDGRERSIADGLFVINSAPPGPPTRIIVRAPARAVLAGSHLTLSAQAVDANDQPVETPDRVTFAVSPLNIAAIAANGLLRAVKPGSAAIAAQSAGARGEIRLAVVGKVARLAVAPLERAYPSGVQFQLTVRAATADGEEIAIDPSAIAWSAIGDAGTIRADGTFRTAATPSRSTVIARAGGARAEATLLVGAHHVILQAAMQPGETAGRWHLISVPSDLAAALDSTNAPDGAAALHLSYDFESASVPGTRAAGAAGEITLPGEPLAIAVEVYGDGSGTWLRAGYRNGDGVNDTLTLARRVEWKGWRSLFASIPVQARWPITLTKLYVVAPRSEKSAGDIWLRNLGLWYPGPPGMTAFAPRR